MKSIHSLKPTQQLAYTEVDTLGLFQLPTYRYLMLFEVQRDLISPKAYLTVSCRSLGFPPASQTARDVSLQAAVLSPSQLGSADCNGADCSGAPPSGAHTDTSIQVTYSRAELQARFLLMPEQPGAVTLQRFVALLCKVAALQLADRQALRIPYQESAPAPSPPGLGGTGAPTSC